MFKFKVKDPNNPHEKTESIYLHDLLMQIRNLIKSANNKFPFSRKLFIIYGHPWDEKDKQKIQGQINFFRKIYSYFTVCEADTQMGKACKDQPLSKISKSKKKITQNVKNETQSSDSETGNSESSTGGNPFSWRGLHDFVKIAPCMVRGNNQQHETLFLSKKKLKRDLQDYIHVLRDNNNNTTENIFRYIALRGEGYFYQGVNILYNRPFHEKCLLGAYRTFIIKTYASKLKKCNLEDFNALPISFLEMRATKLRLRIIEVINDVIKVDFANPKNTTTYKNSTKNNKRKNNKRKRVTPSDKLMPLIRFMTFSVQYICPDSQKEIVKLKSVTSLTDYPITVIEKDLRNAVKNYGSVADKQYLEEVITELKNNEKYFNNDEDEEKTQSENQNYIIKPLHNIIYFKYPSNTNDKVVLFKKILNALVSYYISNYFKNSNLFNSLEETIKNLSQKTFKEITTAKEQIMAGNLDLIKAINTTYKSLIETKIALNNETCKFYNATRSILFKAIETSIITISNINLIEHPIEYTLYNDESPCSPIICKSDWPNKIPFLHLNKEMETAITVLYIILEKNSYLNTCTACHYLFADTEVCRIINPYIDRLEEILKEQKKIIIIIDNSSLLEKVKGSLAFYDHIFSSITLELRIHPSTKFYIKQHSLIKMFTSQKFSSIIQLLQLGGLFFKCLITNKPTAMHEYITKYYYRFAKNYNLDFGEIKNILKKFELEVAARNLSFSSEDAGMIFKMIFKKNKLFKRKLSKEQIEQIYKDFYINHPFKVVTNTNKIQLYSLYLIELVSEMIIKDTLHCESTSFYLAKLLDSFDYKWFITLNDYVTTMLKLYRFNYLTSSYVNNDLRRTLELWVQSPYGKFKVNLSMNRSGDIKKQNVFLPQLPLQKQLLTNYTLLSKNHVVPKLTSFSSDPKIVESKITYGRPDKIIIEGPKKRNLTISHHPSYIYFAKKKFPINTLNYTCVTVLYNDNANYSFYNEYCIIILGTVSGSLCIYSLYSKKNKSEFFINFFGMLRPSFFTASPITNIDARNLTNNYSLKNKGDINRVNIEICITYFSNYIQTIPITLTLNANNHSQKLDLSSLQNNTINTRQMKAEITFLNPNLLLEAFERSDCPNWSGTYGINTDNNFTPNTYPSFVEYFPNINIFITLVPNKKTGKSVYRINFIERVELPTIPTVDYIYLRHLQRNVLQILEKYKPPGKNNKLSNPSTSIISAKFSCPVYPNETSLLCVSTVMSNGEYYYCLSENIIRRVSEKEWKFNANDPFFDYQSCNDLYTGELVIYDLHPINNYIIATTVCKSDSINPFNYIIFSSKKPGDYSSFLSSLSILTSLEEIQKHHYPISQVYKDLQEKYSIIYTEIHPKFTSCYAMDKWFILTAINFRKENEATIEIRLYAMETQKLSVRKIFKIDRNISPVKFTLVQSYEKLLVITMGKYLFMVDTSNTENPSLITQKSFQYCITGIKLYELQPYKSSEFACIFYITDTGYKTHIYLAIIKLNENLHLKEFYLQYMGSFWDMLGLTSLIKEESKKKASPNSNLGLIAPLSQKQFTFFRPNPKTTEQKKSKIVIKPKTTEQKESKLELK